MSSLGLHALRALAPGRVKLFGSSQNLALAGVRLVGSSPVLNTSRYRHFTSSAFIRPSSHNTSSSSSSDLNSLQQLHTNGNLLSQSRSLWTSTVLHDKKAEEKKPEKEGIVKKFKKMAKDYWYVLIPVHVATSIVWFGGFYLMAKSGVDIISVLEAIHVPQSYLEKLQGSDAGYYAIAYACYKVATPARYTVTVGGTTYTIVKLEERGFIKKSSEISDSIKDKKDEMKEKYQDKKDEMKEKYQDKKDEMKEKYQDKKDEMKEKYEDIKDKYKDEWESSWEKFSKTKKK